jgi:transcriptional regulator with XRE-family HTH domain
MITPTQSRMARAALGWNAGELARRAGVGTNTVMRFENGRGTPNQATLTVIRLAFETAGVRFLDDGGIVPPKG